jgi:hypothetical protein
MPAAQAGIVVQKLAMHRIHIPHLIGDIAMAVRTAIGHGRGFPWRGMTCSAVPADLGM